MRRRPTRAVLKVISQEKLCLTDIMSHVRELSSLFHYFNKDIRLVNQLLLGTTPPSTS
jgi:hypothetical protein